MAAGIADVEETMDPQEPRTLIMEEGETAGKGEAPEKSARRPQASGNLLKAFPWLLGQTFQEEVQSP